MDTLRTNTSVVSSVLNLDNQLVWHWYREHLSGFRESESNGEHYRHDFQQSECSEVVRVPILEPDNFGDKMAIDEKQIGEEMHTIISNHKTGKIAVMVKSMNFKELKEVLAPHSEVCNKVKVLTRDLSPLYAKVGEEIFVKSSPVADKFHIIRSLTESCQDVRVRFRQDILREKRLKYQEWKKKEKARREECQSNAKEYVTRKFNYQEETLPHGETALETLARSRYLLFKYPSEWTASQKNRSQALFERFPEIEKVYHRCCEFRNWMKKENVGKDISEIKKQLQTWMQKVEQDDIDEMLNFKSLVERHLTPILNYFIFGATNAIAENINSQIQRFIMINQGTRDREFFYFRLKKYFT